MTGGPSPEHHCTLWAAGRQLADHELPAGWDSWAPEALIHEQGAVMRPG